MIKPIALGISSAAFLTFTFFIVAGFTNLLKENIITGAVIGTEELAVYSILPLILSFMVGAFIVLSMKK